jgi:hypothetical protein
MRPTNSTTGCGPRRSARRAAVERLRTLERDVSDERRALFGVIDRIDQELAARLSAQ